MFPCSLQDFEMFPCSSEKIIMFPGILFCPILHLECTIDIEYTIFATYTNKQEIS